MIILRPATVDESKWIMASFARSYLNPIPMEISAWSMAYVGGVARAAEFLRRSRVLVAETSEVPGVALAWAASEGDLLHYVYTKFSARKQGLARALMRELGPLKRCSHSTPISRVIKHGLIFEVKPWVFPEWPSVTAYGYA